jgi:putative component of toxin-antitoxin plasmid stabilization module
MRNESSKKHLYESSMKEKELFFTFRKEEKRAKIEANRRLKEIQDNNQEDQQSVRRNVSYYY